MAVRGLDDEPVAPRDLVRSINSCKSFTATSNAQDIERWMALLAEELAERLAGDEADHRRRAKSLVLHYRGGGAKGAAVSAPHLRYLRFICMRHAAVALMVYDCGDH